MPITINGSGTITGAETLATTIVSPTLTTPTLTTATLTTSTLITPNINSAQFATVVGTAPIYPCRAWVNFNGSGGATIRASGNVSSVTYNGTGDYTVNFTTAMVDTNYAAVRGAQYFANNEGISLGATLSTGSIRLFTKEPAIGINDSPEVFVAIFR